MPQRSSTADSGTPANRTLPTPPRPHGVPGAPPNRVRPLPEHWRHHLDLDLVHVDEVQGRDGDRGPPDHAADLERPVLEAQRPDRHRVGKVLDVPDVQAWRVRDASSGQEVEGCLEDERPRRQDFEPAVLALERGRWQGHGAGVAHALGMYMT